MAVCVDVMLECKGYAYKVQQYFAVSGWLVLDTDTVNQAVHSK